MKRVILSGVVLCLVLALLAGCGGKKSSSSTTTVTVALSPAAASVNTGQTQQFTVTVTNSSNTAVNWTVNGIAGGNQTVGFISSTGLYTAPNSVPTPATVTVTAISQADTSATGSASVTVTAAATPSASLTISPQSVTVPAGGQQTFAATVSGAAIPVNWTLNCLSAVANACGTISATGVYTAPAAPPPGANVTVTAAAKDNSVPASAAVVTVQFGNGTLSGNYSFTFSGQLGNASYVAAGSISFDGNGNITGGSIDVNSGGVSAVTITGGTYHIGSDGRGNAALATSAGAMNWQFVAVNHSRAFVARFDSGVQSASGTLDLQDASQFTAAAVSGNYSFNLSGAGASGKPGSLAAAGAFTSNGALLISSGVEDVNDAGVVSTGTSVSGIYAAPSAATGRGTLTLNGTPFAYYIVDGTHVKLVGTSAAAQLVGDTYKQPAGPFNNAGIRGGFAFAMLGSSSTGALGEGGVFTLDGTGNVTGGTLDLNKNGNPQNSLSVSAGTYNVADATTGRTTVTITAGGLTFQYAVYPQINGALSVVEIDASNVVSGRALGQSGAPFGGGSLLGNFAMNLTGTEFVPSTAEEDVVGAVVPNGGSAMSGTVAISDNGTLTPSSSLGASYTVSSSGRGSATLTTNSAAFGTFNLYVADNSDALFLESDGTRVLAGMMQKQF